MRPDTHTLVAAYAAHALEEPERADVREHLARCEVCRDDVRGYRETLAAMATASAEVPPARMREAVMARARLTPQLPPLPPATAAAPPAAEAEGADEAGAAVDGAVPAPRHGARSRSGAGVSRSLFALAASALTVVALAAGAWGLTSSERLSDVRAQQATVQQVLSAEDVVSVAGRPQLGGGVQGDEVVVLASASADAALLLPAGLPAAPDGSTWQAWTLTGDQATSAGLFDVDGGDAVALSGGVAGVDSVAVTLEPAGGSAAPTTDPVLVVPLV